MQLLGSFKNLCQKLLLFLNRGYMSLGSYLVYKLCCNLKDIIEHGAVYKARRAFLGMTQQNMAMPDLCDKCGSVFDMSWDLPSYEEEIENELENKPNLTLNSPQTGKKILSRFSDTKK